MNPSESKAGIRTRYNRTHAVCFCLGSSKESELIPLYVSEIPSIFRGFSAMTVRTSHFAFQDFFLKSFSGSTFHHRSHTLLLVSLVIKVKNNRV